jgi:septal ring factor EnvC (AmiA/AmiB activator)
MLNLNLRISQFWPVLMVAFLSSQSFGATQDQLDQLEQSLKDSNTKQATISAELDATLKAQAEITAKLIRLGKTLGSQQQAIGATDNRVKKLESEAIIIRSDLAAKQEALSGLLAGLQRLEQNPPPALVVDPQDVLQALRGAMLFGAVVPELQNAAHDLKVKLIQLSEIRAKITDEKKNKAEGLAALQNSLQELKALQAEKKILALNTAKDLEAEKAHAASLAEEAQNLKQLLAKLEADRIDEEQRKTAEIKAQEEATKIREANLNRPPMVLSQAQGKLAYPLQGDILKQFGDDNGLGSKLDGTAIATQAGLTVTAPVDGKVEFAGLFRSYGQLLILDAGEGYLVLLAGMNHISAEIGQSIRAGEPVGTMGDGPSSVALIGGETETARPVLYVEFRKNNEPVDPSLWWVGGRKEAMR